MMLNPKLLIDREDLDRECRQRVAAFSVTEFPADAIPRAAQLLNGAHRVMDGPQLGFQLRDESHLVHDDLFGLYLERDDACGPIGILFDHTQQTFLQATPVTAKLTPAEVASSLQYLAPKSPGAVPRDH